MQSKSTPKAIIVPDSDLIHDWRDMFKSNEETLKELEGPTVLET